jgi:hypothetical protein
MRWRRIEASGTPPAGRTDHSLVTDGQSLLMFGGRTNGAPLGDLWAYNLAEEGWTQLSSEGGPSDRFGHNAAYDPATGGDRSHPASAERMMIVFGGQAGGDFFNDLWIFNPLDGTWVNPSPGEVPIPAPRYGAAAAITHVGLLLISHGFTNSGRFDDTWTGPAQVFWADVSPAGTRPVKRCLCRGAWDSARNRFLMFGGQTDGTPFLGDLWALDLEASSWTEITSEPKPSPRNFYAMAETDPGRIALFGGNTPDGPGPMNDLWFFDSQTDTWTLARPEGEAPSARYGHDAVWLPETRRFIVFGGHDASGDLNDLWELTIPA